jgi:hypothetical protein
MRKDWVTPRIGKENVTQMHYARQGIITEEMVTLLGGGQSRAIRLRLPMTFIILVHLPYTLSQWASALPQGKIMPISATLHRFICR